MNDKLSFTFGSKIGSTVLGIGLILVGILFLIGQFAGRLFDFDIGHYGWPFFIIIPGLLLFTAAFALDRQAGLPLAMVGGMVTFTGVILLVQNTFDLFASWAYAWALVAPTSMGLAQLVYGFLRGMREQVRTGLILTGVGLAIFVFVGSFFELVIGLNGFHIGAARRFWPALLIGLGVALLLRNLRSRRNQPSA